MKYTQGKWELNGFNTAEVIVVKEGPDYLGRVYQDGRHQVTIAEVGEMHTPHEERLANARLIAASPMLAELLLAALPYVEEGEEFNKPHKRNLSKQIRELLKQATGE